MEGLIGFQFRGTIDPRKPRRNRTTFAQYTFSFRSSGSYQPAHSQGCARACLCRTATASKNVSEASGLWTDRYLINLI